MNEMLLEIEGLSKSFGPVHAVDGVTLRVRAGETVALLGPNGSGKTTVLRCVAGLLRARARALRIAGRDALLDPCGARTAMSYVPQVAVFAKAATVEEVLRLHASLRGAPASRARAALAEVGMGEEVLRRRVGELSVGMRQRLSLAVALIPDVQLMVLDEPTANVDPEAALRFRDLVRRWRSAGRAVVLATHVLADAEHLADRVVVLVGGRVASEESAASLRERLQRQAQMRVTVDTPSEAHLSAARAAGAIEVRLNCRDVIVTAPGELRFEVLRSLAELGPIRQLHTEEPSLEHVYLDFVRGQSDARPSP